MIKIKVFHFYNGSGGGVLSVIKNLIEFSSNNNIENHVIHTINKDSNPNYDIEIVKGAISQQLFYFSSKNNFYFTCSQLAKILPDKNVIIVAHDWIELGMVSNLGLQNQVIHFLHGDYEYYYQLAKKNETIIDTFICVSHSIQQKLLIELPNRKKDIKYLCFPVPNTNEIYVKTKANNIIFLGRLTKQKGYNIIPKIANTLYKKGINVNWHIVGTSNDTKFDNFNQGVNLKKYGDISNTQVQLVLEKMNLIVLPSLAEGMPISIIEAMKAGVVPLVNDIAGGIQELVINSKTGYKITNNNVDDYVNCIVKLLENFELAEQLGNNAKEMAKKLFDPYKNTIAIEDEYFLINRKRKLPNKVYGSRLDHPLIPNFVTKNIRKLSK